MSVPANCARYVYRGSLPNGEVWQTGFWLQGAAPTSNDDAAAAAELEMDSEGNATPSSLWNVLKSLLPTSVSLDNVAVYSYPAGGTSAAFIGVSTHAPWAGTAAADQIPNQVCMVATLRTAAAGRSFRGRMYLPAGGNMFSGGSRLFSTSMMTNIATALATKFQDFDNVSASIGTAVVVSQTRTLATPITAVTIDSRPDIQRRRSNKTTGITRVSEAVTPP